MTTTPLPAVQQTGATSLGDYGASVLRTAVPTVWGTLLGWLLAWALPRLPGDVGEALATLLRSDLVTGLLVAVTIAVWYAVARWAEPRIPDWLTRLVLGSAAAPTYARVADGVAVVTTLDGTEHTGVLPTSAGEADPYPLPGHWSNGDPVHLIIGGPSGQRVAPNLNGATWVPEADEPRHLAE